MGEPELLTVKEAAAMTGYSPARLYQMIRKGQFPYCMIGPRSMRVPRRALTLWLERHTDAALANCDSRTIRLRRTG